MASINSVSRYRALDVMTSMSIRWLLSNTDLLLANIDPMIFPDTSSQVVMRVVITNALNMQAGKVISNAKIINIKLNIRNDVMLSVTFPTREKQNWAV